MDETAQLKEKDHNICSGNVLVCRWIVHGTGSGRKCSGST